MHLPKLSVQTLSLQKLSLQKLSRPVGTWLGFSGLYALMGGACPCCGQAVCPTNVLGVGVVGLVMTAALRLFRRFSRRKESEIE